MRRGKRNVGKNIEELVAAGHPREQAIAIALKVAGEHKEFGDGDPRSKRARKPDWGVLG